MSKLAKALVISGAVVGALIGLAALAVATDHVPNELKFYEK